ncbi:hypothetical protein BKA65DRAFT_546677 [Rhexocercosporidium sp. MPI-PUGE-AT-0058]|nr:hypothetical protein BKA65DRAFT_546677 [Rhexocercosporidium sp. MPI-PUGE-AT-0058]
MSILGTTVECTFQFLYGGKKRRAAFKLFKSVSRRVMFGTNMATTMTALYGQPTEPQNCYRNIKLHMMQWENETAKCVCGPELDRLASVFKGFELHSSPRFLIPDYNSMETTRGYIRDALSECSQGDLLILYYSGHGIEPGNGEGWKLAGKNARFEWSPLHSMLRKSKADILLLLDACHSAAATKGATSATQLVIAACDSGQNTNSPPPAESLDNGEYTFTAALIHTLKGMSADGQGRQNFSAITIRQGIDDRMAFLRPSYPYKSELMHSPILTALSGDDTCQDIRLMPA